MHAATPYYGAPVWSKGRGDVYTEGERHHNKIVPITTTRESLMNVRFIVSVIVVFIWTMIAGMVVHGVLLGPDYAALPNLFRPEADQMAYFPYMIAAHISMAIGITWVYRMGREDGKPWLAQGVRFGIALYLLMTLSIYLIYYAVQPMPAALAHKQLIYDGVAVILTGIITAFVNK